MYQFPRPPGMFDTSLPYLSHRHFEMLRSLEEKALHPNEKNVSKTPSP